MEKIKYLTSEKGDVGSFDTDFDRVCGLIRSLPWLLTLLLNSNTQMNVDRKEKEKGTKLVCNCYFATAPSIFSF